MIAKEPDGPAPTETILSHEQVIELFDVAVEDALAESRRMGVPISHHIDGKICFELPDGTLVDEDPWHGEQTAPEGWYERFGIEPPEQKSEQK